MYAGDAVQKLLPRDFRVPYIGWHPVEDKMTPRNLYDHTKVILMMKMLSMLMTVITYRPAGVGPCPESTVCPRIGN